nr:MAG TPA_asm: hypothetical protein [Caudoviricetes sp.]
MYVNTYLKCAGRKEGEVWRLIINHPRYDL